MSTHRGPDLPYTLVAAVTPWTTKWIVASAKLHTATFAPQVPQIFGSFEDILSERPAYSVIVINVPIGYKDEPQQGGRTCDREARALLRRRAPSVLNAPSRSVLEEGADWTKGHLDAVTATLLPRYREIAKEMSPFRQRVIYEGHPELSFLQLNGGKPLRWSKTREEGRQERRAILEKKIQGVRNIVDAALPRVPQKHLFDVAAMLWTARRVQGHAAKRIPADAEWDSEGLRMELVM